MAGAFGEVVFACSSDDRVCTGYDESARFMTTASKKLQRNARFASRSRR